MSLSQGGQFVVECLGVRFLLPANSYRDYVVILTAVVPFTNTD